MAEDFQEKSEEATSKKLSDARKKGQVAKSQDLTAGVLLLAGSMLLYFGAENLNLFFQHLFVAVLSNLYEPVASVETAAYWFGWGLYYTALAMIPLFIGLFVVSFGISAAQVGLEFSAEAMQFRWKQLNIFQPSNYKKFFNTQALSRLVFGLSKLFVVGIVVYFVIATALPQISQMMKANTIEFYLFISWQSMLISSSIAFILVILGIADFAFQKWRFSQEMKMSKQEVKEERKQSDGDPQIKSKIRAMMQGFSQSRMRENVPHANVVIANPVHFAIAIKYDPEQMSAPICIAKGARKLAISIKELAKEHNIPIVENPPLARALYKTVSVGTLIPPAFYHAVAEVLAYVFRLEKKLQKEGQGKVK